jgi:hypothetical protein
MSTQVGCRRETAPAAPAAPAPVAARPLVVGAKMAPAEPHSKSFDGGPVEFIRDTMDEIYPKICVYHSMPQGQRANLWTNRYHGRWIHWTGKVRAFTQNGLGIVQRPESLTFDVSLRMDADQMAKLQQHVKVGERVTYEGQLDTYDDIFQKIYLLHGTVLAVNPPDGGI